MSVETMTSTAFISSYLHGGMALVLRGIPGAGKTTFVEKIKDAVIHGDDSPSFWVESCSADGYRMLDGKYVYDPKNNGEMHRLCLRRFMEVARLRTVMNMEEVTGMKTVLVCDNTNISSWEASPYIGVAAAFGWTPVLVTIASNPETAGPRNLHGVPLWRVTEMCERANLFGLPPGWDHIIIKD